VIIRIFQTEPEVAEGMNLCTNIYQRKNGETAVSAEVERGDADLEALRFWKREQPCPTMSWVILMLK